MRTGTYRHLLLAIIGLVLITSTVQADTIESIAELLRKTQRSLFGKSNPRAPQDYDVEELAKELDWLEHLIETYGTVVPKQPDVWGEVRLTQHRHQYEQELNKRFSEAKFKDTLQASIRQSDQSVLSLAFALNAASGGATAPTSNAASTLITSNDTTSAITRIPPTGLNLNDFSNQATSLSLEPTIEINQLSRYLQNINELRRINEGDDTADSPGYALNLLRIPVSVLSGHNTRRGYGAEIAFTLAPFISEDLLPTTMRTLLINDVADTMSLPLAQLFNNDRDPTRRQLDEYATQRGRVARWMEAIDAWIASLDSPASAAEAVCRPALESDIQYLYTLRPYIQLRLLQIAADAEPQNAMRANAQASDDRPEFTFDIGPGRKATISAKQLAVGLDRLHDRVALAKQPLHPSAFDAILEVCVCVADNVASCCKDGSKEQSGPVLNIPPGVYSVHCRLFNLTEIKPGDLVDRGKFPLAIQAGDQAPRAQIELLPPTTPVPRGSGSPQSPRSVLPTPGSSERDIGVARQRAESYAELNKGLENVKPNVGVSLQAQFQYAFRGPLNDIMSIGGRPIPVQSGVGQRPMSASQMWITYGLEPFMDFAVEAHDNLRSNPANRPFIHQYDIHQYVIQEGRVAYDLLCHEPCIRLWRFCTPALAQAVDERDARTLFLMRREFMTSLGGFVKNTAVASLAWALIVDAARLNARLVSDMQSIAQAKGCGCIAAGGQQFVGPKELLAPEAHEAFKQYVLCRWPVIVFALDPVTEDQNVAEKFNRSRELQLSVAVAVANGSVNPNAAGRFVRRLEMEMETISLNRTAVAFSHANDTFGWRFYPRVQTPETPGTLGAFGQTLLGGPSRDHDIRDRQLEPGMRDCSAVVIMPSFVPYMTVNSRANWFGLTNPRKKCMSVHDAMRISRTYQTLHEATAQSSESPLYRPGDISQLANALGQMERRLPMQTMTIEIPYQNTLGGFELFETGVSGLGPQLIGWYGAPGIDPYSVTTLYLVGKKFSVLETQIIAGGRQVPFRMLSRNVLEISIPPGAQPLADPEYSDFVDVQAAAPYGPSSHMLIPRVVKTGTANRFVWATSAAALEIVYKPPTPAAGSTAATPAAPVAILTAVPPEIQLRTPSLGMPTKLGLMLTINEVSAGRELPLYKAPLAAAAITTPTLSARLDVRTGRYVIDREQFNTLLDTLNAAFLARAGYQAPTPNQVVRWMLRGTAWLDAAGNTQDNIEGAMVLDVTFTPAP